MRLLKTLWCKLSGTHERLFHFGPHPARPFYCEFCEAPHE